MFSTVSNSGGRGEGRKYYTDLPPTSLDRTVRTLQAIRLSLNKPMGECSAVLLFGSEIVPLGAVREWGETDGPTETQQQGPGHGGEE